MFCLVNSAEMSTFVVMLLLLCPYMRFSQCPKIQEEQTETTSVGILGGI